MIRVAFFDMDGTISVPRYPVGDHLQPCMTDEQWQDFNAHYRERSYDWCKPIEPVIRYAKMLKDNGAAVYVLTGVHSDPEVAGKRSFLEKHCPGVFDELIPVQSDPEKLVVMKDYCEKHDLAYQECELIEDTYMNVIHAVCEGFAAKHVMNVLDELEII